MHGCEFFALSSIHSSYTWKFKNQDKQTNGRSKCIFVNEEFKCLSTFSCVMTCLFWIHNVMICRERNQRISSWGVEIQNVSWGRQMWTRASNFKTRIPLIVIGCCACALCSARANGNRLNTIYLFLFF